MVTRAVAVLGHAALAGHLPAVNAEGKEVRGWKAFSCQEPLGAGGCRLGGCARWVRSWRFCAWRPAPPRRPRLLPHPPLAAEGAAALRPSPSAPRPAGGDAASNPEEELPVFYDFTLDENGKYHSEALFPRPSLLPGLKEAWEGRWLSAPAPGEDRGRYDPGFANWVRENGRTCGLQWAYTGDFDGDGSEETFFCYGMSTPMRPTAGLYLLQADGALLALDEAPYFGGWVIRYPGFSHLLISSDYGTGLSLRRGIGLRREKGGQAAFRADHGF